MYRSKNKSGFTLIELLVVIAIIAILAAILFPVFARAKAKAQQTVCLNNLKQITFAALMYCSDFENTAPSCLDSWYVNSNRTWTMCLWPYISPGAWDPNFIQTTTCPSARVGLRTGGGPYSHTNYDANGVIMCRDVVGSGGQAYGVGVNMDSIPNVHEIIMFYDIMGANWPHIQIYADFSPRSTGTPGEYSTFWQIDSSWAGPHNFGHNCGYADGHAKYVGFGSGWGTMLRPEMLGVTLTSGSGWSGIYTANF